MNDTPFDDSFVELNRTFRELSSTDSDKYESDLLAMYFAGKPTGWDTLIAEHRVILLAEAGSGKTREIRNVAQQLRADNKPAFFLRLEHIRSDFEEAFEEGTFAEFEAWIAGDEEGRLLLDSIDEARLKSPSDFELAVRKVANRIKSALQRTHIVITGRTTAWRPKTDLALCQSNLPYSRPVEKPKGLSEGKTPAQDAVVVGSRSTSKDSPSFHIVSLENLNSGQIEKFARAKRVEDTAELIEAIERADAFSFTSRPQDLAEVVEFWKTHRRIGSRLELMRNSIDRRLAERDENRAIGQPMSAERARAGAQLIAGATTLAQEQTIRVPDGAENLEGLPVRGILPSWDERDTATLLGRPIFDAAIYGTVRFHHRSVREYLAAEWLAKLLSAETSRAAIEDIFFRFQYGVEVVVPSARPVLPWLILLDQGIRDRALRIAPQIMFEGGDPSQLPLETRSKLLAEICQNIATDRAYRADVDYSAVQRFASVELTDLVNTLLEKYAKNADVTWLLLRMVWQGRLKGALPLTKRFALDPRAPLYSRIAAFRAVAAVGSEDDQSEVRQAFLGDRREIKRKWFAELLSVTKPSPEATVWLVKALPKIPLREEFELDGVGAAIHTYIELAPLADVATIMHAMAKLLGRPPIEERHYCEVSKRYRWLAKLAGLAVQRLVEVRDPEALSEDALDILRRSPMANDRDDFELRKIELQLPGLVQGWSELNEALFWFDVAATRRSLDRKKGERLDEWWRLQLGHAYWGWRFVDVDRILGFMSNRRLQDDKLIALSLGFYLYRTNDRPVGLRRALHRATRGNAEMEARLHNYLNPPAQSAHEREWRRKHREFERRRAKQEAKEAKIHEDWRIYLTENIEALRNPPVQKPQYLTNSQHYLLDQIEDDGNHNRWRSGNWPSLIPKFGREIAEAFRDGCIGYWRRNRPKLRSEGAVANRTFLSTIFGISGIGMEAETVADWPRHLSEADVEIATRYATHELNGFPSWMPKLYAAFPDTVTRVLLGEVRWELAHDIPETDRLYVLYDISWYGEQMWEKWGPILLAELSQAEPVNLRSLDEMLKIIQGSPLPDEQIRDVAAVKCTTLTDPERLAQWYSVWVGVDPGNAIPALSRSLDAVGDPDTRLRFAMRFVTHLVGGRHSDGATARHAYRSATHLKSLYILMNKHIQQRDDIERAGKGVYSPGLRDNAQEARNHLFNVLNELPGKEAFLALEEISKDHPAKESRPYFRYHARIKAQQDAERGPWKLAQFVDFNEHLERTPDNNAELFELAVWRLTDLKNDLENGDSSIAATLRKVTLEPEMRKVIGNWLREHANGRYIVPQEEEFADGTKPDVRFHAMGADVPVPMELKLADNWTGPHLFERLQNQLCGDYLRDQRSHRGIFALVYRGKTKRWQLPNSKERVGFDELVVALQRHWEKISPLYPNAIDARVIGIDLTARDRKFAVDADINGAACSSGA